jgi:hypothetical protein
MNQQILEMQEKLLEALRRMNDIQAEIHGVHAQLQRLVVAPEQKWLWVDQSPFPKLCDSGGELWDADDAS